MIRYDFFFIAEFVYNNTKNANIGHTSFKFYQRYYTRIFYKKNSDLCSKLRIAEKLYFRL